MNIQCDHVINTTIDMVMYMERRLFQNYFCQLYHLVVFFVKFSLFYLVSFAVSFLCLLLFFGIHRDTAV